MTPGSLPAGGAGIPCKKVSLPGRITAVGHSEAQWKDSWPQGALGKQDSSPSSASKVLPGAGVSCPLWALVSWVMVELLLLPVAPAPPAPTAAEQGGPPPPAKTGQGEPVGFTSQGGSCVRECLPRGRLRRAGTHPEAEPDAACAQGLASPRCLEELVCYSH